MQRESKSIKRANGKRRMYPNEQKDKKKESRCTKVFVNQSAIVLAVSSVWVFQKTISKDCCWHSIQKIVISFTYLKSNNKSHITFYYIWQWKSMMNEITLLVNEITRSDADNFQYLIFGGKLDYFKDCLNFYLKIFLKKYKKVFFVSDLSSLWINYWNICCGNWELHFVHFDFRREKKYCFVFVAVIAQKSNSKFMNKKLNQSQD